MAYNNSYKFFVSQIFIVMFISFTIEIIIAGYEDETNLITIYQTTAVGSSVELACNVTDNKFGVSWLRDDQGLSLGKVVYQQWQTIYLLNTSRFTNISNHFMYNLVVQNLTESVAGLYICQEQGVKITKVNLSVEVPPVIWLQKGDMNISNVINVTLNEEMDIRCIAVGGKPTVSLFWEKNGEDEVDGVTPGIVSNGVASTLNYRPNINDKIVSCKTSGQIVVPSLRRSVSINVLYPPTCHILANNDSSVTYSVTCVCVANPEVSSLVIIVNKFPYDDGKTVSLPVTLPAIIYCRAGNGVGFFETDKYHHRPPIASTTHSAETQLNTTENPSKGSPAIIVVLLAVVVVVVAALVIVGFIFYKQYQTYTVTSTYSPWDSSAGQLANSSGSRTLSSRPPCPSPVVTHRIISTVDPNYAYVPSRQVGVANGISQEKPKVTLDAVVEGDAYNLQYFQIPRQSVLNAENEYASADLKETESNENEQTHGSSAASSFSDEQYFCSSIVWDLDNPRGSEIRNSDKLDPYEWTESTKEVAYEWAKPNKGKSKEESL